MSKNGLCLKTGKLAAVTLHFIYPLEQSEKNWYFILTLGQLQVGIVNIELPGALFCSCVDEISSIHYWNVTTCLLVT